MTLCFTSSALRTAQNVGAWRIDFDSMISSVRSIHRTEQAKISTTASVRGIAHT